MKEATLVLQDGTVFKGKSFGYEADAVGEVVFNTAMTGYPESLTDPSYAGQILVFTYPLIGNYGVPDTGDRVSSYTTGRQQTGNGQLPLFVESDRIHPKAVIVADYSEHYSHWNAKESLTAWLKREHIPAITGIDTRRLTKVLREQGVMMGRVVVDEMRNEDCGVRNEDYGSVNWVEKVSCKEVITYRPESNDSSRFTFHSSLNSSLFTLHSSLESPPRVVLVDCGVKANIIRCLVKRGVEVIRVPWDYDFNQLEFDGLFLANGPGNPEQCKKTVEHIRMFLQKKDVRPCMGICLGNQLLARAAGAQTYKLKYGHRSHNQPVMMVNHEPFTMNHEPATVNHCCFITSQNHGYAVDDSTLPSD